MQKRKEWFKAMSSEERKALIRKKMKAEGLTEGSGVKGKSLTSYDQEEIRGLIEVTRHFPEMETKRTRDHVKAPKKKKSLIPPLILAMVLATGMIFYYQQYPLQETRKEISINGLFWD